MFHIIGGLISLSLFCIIAGWIINGFNRLIQLCNDLEGEEIYEGLDSLEIFMYESMRSKNNQNLEFRKIVKRYIVSYWIAKMLMSTLELVARISELDKPEGEKENWSKIYGNKRNKT